VVVPQTEEPDDPDLAAWREIVAHYGERAELPPEGGSAERTEPADRAEPAGGASYPLRFGEFGDDTDEPFEPVAQRGTSADDADLADPVEDRFVPLEPEPLRLGPARTAAWLGVLGAPALALLATFVVTASDVSVPSWFGWLLVAAFLGGFGYLVVTMPKDRDDPWDDGARL
jgi:hypothetical protein